MMIATYLNWAAVGFGFVAAALWFTSTKVRVLNGLEGKAPQAIEHSGQLDTGSDGKDAATALLAKLDAMAGRLPDKDPTD